MCELEDKMLFKAFCVMLLTSLCSVSGTNTEQNRQVVYEKCRGPGKLILLSKLPNTSMNSFHIFPHPCDTSNLSIRYPRPMIISHFSTKGEPGPCKSFLYKWRFEATTQECITFIWGGCQGNNQNRFDTEVECLANCIGGNRK